MRQRLELRRDFQRGKFRSHSELETITLHRVSRLGPGRELNLGARFPAHLSVGGSTVDTQSARAEAFKSLHDRSGIFAIPNPWDAGSASILTTLGFEALATTSAGFAFSVGRPDAEGAIGREETLANARTIDDVIRAENIAKNRTEDESDQERFRRRPDQRGGFHNLNRQSQGMR